MAYQIRKVFKFEGAHVLTSAYSKECMKIHGHGYIIEVYLRSEMLNDSGMIVDFKFLKERIKCVFDEWDHALVVSQEEKRSRIRDAASLIVPFNPTAENMAKFFYDGCKAHFSEISKVRVHETATGWAEYYEPELHCGSF